MQQFDTRSTARPRIAIVGAGRLGTTLGLAFSQAGYPVIACASRTRAHAEEFAGRVPGCRVAATAAAAGAAADWVFLTVPDDLIAPVAAQIPWNRRQLAVHCSGARPAAIIENAARAGARVAGFHPLQTFADTDGGLANLPGSTVGVEADDETWPQLATLATAIGTTPLRIGAEQRARYHLGSVVVSNFTVGLMALAADLWEPLGVERVAAVRALLPLLQGTMRNIDALGVPAALTGPVVRGDAGTVARHLDALRDQPDARAAYLALSRLLVDLAEDGGRLPSDQAAKLREILGQEAECAPADAEGRA